MVARTSLAAASLFFGATVYGQAAPTGSAVAATGQQPGGPAIALREPPVPLLPKQFGAWQQTAQAADGSASAATSDGASAAALRDDGVTRVDAQTYTRAGSGDTILLKAYEFGDATGAFAAYTYLRRPADRPIPGARLGKDAVEDGDAVMLWDGRTVVSALFHGGRRLTDLQDLVPQLPKIGGPKGLAPLLPTLLPTKGLQTDTLKYALGPASYQAMGGVLPAEIVGFDKSAEVVTAKYAGRGTLTLLLYPTPQIAGEHGREIEAEMNREGASAGTVKLRREGPLVLLTTGSWTPAEAQKLVEEIHLRDQLTWNKPLPVDFHSEVRKTASLLTNILLLTGALFLAAIILALFFGGGRALIRVMQGKPAATEPEFLHIDLREGPGDGGRFKPLH
ncbi:MAG TPA: DUF6599 family protein [Granulicella sp.]|jgi:hypothetical protein|nr:DUF6599 family protein [Granulicella sp.]